ncbi:hypothetical protein BDZ89DRAFT_1134504 [Hymenopellis radicata]|nr:hypothetical protein BDZ89DRAFT_1134504 [Hymenopellis radicata]
MPVDPFGSFQDDDDDKMDLDELEGSKPQVSPPTEVFIRRTVMFNSSNSTLSVLNCSQGFPTDTPSLDDSAHRCPLSRCTKRQSQSRDHHTLRPAITNVPFVAAENFTHYDVHLVRANTAEIRANEVDLSDGTLTQRKFRMNHFLTSVIAPPSYQTHVTQLLAMSATMDASYTPQLTPFSQRFHYDHPPPPPPRAPSPSLSSASPPLRTPSPASEAKRDEPALHPDYTIGAFPSMDWEAELDRWTTSPPVPIMEEWGTYVSPLFPLQGQGEAIFVCAFL